MISRLLVAAALLCLCREASAHSGPAVDCAVVRAHVEEHGRAKAIAWARSQGYGWRDIWRIRKLCRV